MFLVVLGLFPKETGLWYLDVHEQFFYEFSIAISESFSRYLTVIITFSFHYKKKSSCVSSLQSVLPLVNFCCFRVLRNFCPFTKYLIHLSQAYGFPYCRPFWYSSIHATSFSFMKEKLNKVSWAEIKQFASCIFQVWMLSLDWYFTFCFTLNTFLYVFP